jgi:hypothetical protein
VRLRIGAHDYMVEEVADLCNDSGERIWGQHRPAEGLILWHGCLRDNPTRRLQTILHEVIHAIDTNLGLTLDEATTDRLAEGLAQVVLDNRDELEQLMPR